MSPKKWTREKVIEAIQLRQQRGLPMAVVWRDDQSLYTAAKKFFGSWQGALLAVGVPGARAFHRWSKERVIAAIRDRHARGESLLKTWREDRHLYDAAARRFSSWRQALLAAGFTPTIAPKRYWTKQQVLDAIRARHGRGLPLTGMTHRDPSLGNAAVRLFGTWRQAVTAAGVEVKRRQSWTREDVIEAIRAQQRQGLSMSNIHRRDPPLVRAALRRFGIWKRAMLAAGFQPKTQRRWTREKVIQEIRNWHRRESTTSVWKDDVGLGGAAARYFGGWRAALKAAGLPPRQRTWSRELVLKALLAWHRGPHKAALSREDKGLYVAAKSHFGTYENALLAAGLEPPPRDWSKQEVIEAIQDRHIRGQSLRGREASQDLEIFSAATRRFGSWRKAVQAAGFDVGKRRRRTKWSRERVVAEIRHRHARGWVLSRVWKEDKNLAAAAIRHFGTWSKAVAAAGISLEGGKR